MDARTALSAGLFAAWAVHDAEEVATMAATSRRVLGAAPRKLPIPEPLRSRGLSQAHVTLSVALMSLPVATAAFQGIRTRCRSRWFRGAVLAFGVHGFTHLASSVATRGYTTGVATAPVVVLPYWFLARRVLHQHGLAEIDRSTAAAALAVLPLTVGAHLLAAAILGERSLGPEL